MAQSVLSIENCTFVALYREIVASSLSSKPPTAKSVRHALCTLLRHHCLSVELPSDTDISSLTVEDKLKLPGLLYSIIVENVLNRQRFGALLVFVQEKFGEIAKTLVEEVKQCRG